MTSAARVVRTARRSQGFSQQDLAHRAHRTQSEISRLECSAQSVRHELVSLLVRAANQRLVAVPTDRTPVAEHADEIAALLASGDRSGAWREAIQLANDLSAEHGATRVALAVAPPPPTGDDRYDALIAGITEIRLDEEDLPHPSWLDTTTSASDSPWAPDEHVLITERAIEATPAPLRRRGIVLTADDLSSW